MAKKERSMKIGVIGANSRVGTELCFLLREEAEVIPIVRNQVAASTFDHHGFPYRVTDITNPSEAEKALPDLDVVVIIAFAFPGSSRGRFRPKQSRQTNESLVRNSFAFSQRDATIIYFSSIAAFGEEIGRSEWWVYVREKRHIEELFTKLQDSTTKRGYIFRVGLVFGPTQEFKEIIEDGISNPKTYVQTDPQSVSNIVHTVTLTEAILLCSRSNIPPNRYTLVNKPQWTWEDVIGYYAPDYATITYNGGKNKYHERIGLSDIPKEVGQMARNTKIEEILRGYAVYFPAPILQRLEHIERRNGIETEIQEYKDGLTFHIKQFEYNPAPGPVIENLTNTQKLLEKEDALNDFIL